MASAAPAPAPTDPKAPDPARERGIILCIGAVQFINILDFMVVTPLGPDFARALGIGQDRLGLVTGSYTAAAFVSGLVGSAFLDRFDRRSALAVAMLGLVVGTAAAGFATGLGSLVAARMLAGLFGGPATSLSLSVVADAIPAERRGRAMGAVMGAFSAASVLGVPAGLRLARLGTWHTPFFAVAALGLVVTLLAVRLLPPMRGHLVRSGEQSARQLFEPPLRAAVLGSYAMTLCIMTGSFSIIPNLSPYLQQNLHFPRPAIEELYLVGGVASFLAMRWIIGPLTDRAGATSSAAIGTVLMSILLWITFVPVPPPLPVRVLFPCFMVFMSFRNVAYKALTSRVPPAALRARYLSFQSAMEHLAASIGAAGSSLLLSEGPGQSLVGMPRIAIGAIGIAWLALFLMARLERTLGATTTAV